MKWISVKDQPFPKEGEFLVYHPKDKAMSVKQFVNAKKSAWGQDALMDMDGWHYCIEYYSHWMPLPEPPNQTS